MIIDDAQRAALEGFGQAVLGSPHNLVSKRARDELWSRHIPECVAFAGLLDSNGGRVLDLGSGGGFPGIVIAIVRPDLEVHLLDSVAKKTAFLRAQAEVLNLSITVHTGRAEDLARDARLAGSFRNVTARAVAPLHRLVPWASPFLSPGGTLFAIKGARWEQELSDAGAVIRRAGLDVIPPALDVDTSTGEVPLVVRLRRPAEPGDHPAVAPRKA